MVDIGWFRYMKELFKAKSNVRPEMFVKGFFGAYPQHLRPRGYLGVSDCNECWNFGSFVSEASQDLRLW